MPSSLPKATPVDVVFVLFQSAAFSPAVRARMASSIRGSLDNDSGSSDNDTSDRDGLWVSRSSEYRTLWILQEGERIQSNFGLGSASMVILASGAAGAVTLRRWLLR
jgi:hypothetical protein